MRLKAILLCLLVFVAVLPATAQKKEVKQGIRYSASETNPEELLKAIELLTEYLPKYEEASDAEMAEGYFALGSAYIHYRLSSAAFTQFAGRIEYPFLKAQEAFETIKNYQSADSEFYKRSLNLRREFNLVGNLYSQANTFYQEQKYELALKFLSAVELEFTVQGAEISYGIYQLKAYSNLQQGDSLAAYGDFKSAIKLFKAQRDEEKELMEGKGPDESMVGVYYYATQLADKPGGDINRAIEYADEAIELFPDDQNLRSLWLSLYQRPEVRDVAMDRMKKEHEAKPDDEQIALAYAIMVDYDENSTDEEAIELYKKVLVMNPLRYEANKNLAGIYLDQANAIADKAKESDDNEARKKANDEINALYQQALKLLETAHQQAPEDYSIISTLLQLTTILGMEEESQMYLKKKQALEG